MVTLGNPFGQMSLTRFVDGLATPGRKPPRSRMRMRLPLGATRWASVPPPATGADDDYIVRLKRQPPNLHLESATRR